MMWINRPLPFALILITTAAVVLLALNPRPGVRLEGEIAMLEPSVALQRLDAASNIDVQDNLALTHAALALDAGELVVAINVLRRLQQQGQASVEIKLMLADASRLSGDTAGELKYLAAAYALEPTSALRQELGLAYRANRLSTPERALLLDVNSLDLTSYEAKRLADLLRQDRQFTQLEDLYRGRADGEGPDADEAKQLLLNILLESGRLPEAQQQAMRWFEAAHRDQQILETALPAFVNWGAIDEAMSLAVASLQVAPKTSYRMIAVFLDGGHQDRAFAFQQTWLQHIGIIPDEAWQTLIDCAERTGNLAGLRTALSMTPPDVLPTKQLSDIILQFLRYQGVQSLYPQTAYLRPDVLRAQPIIGAAFAASQGNQMEAAAFLIDAGAGDLTEWDWQIWGNIAASLNGSPAYQKLLAASHLEIRARTFLEMSFMARLN